MTDTSIYVSSTVKDLKEELKKRGIPSTGLTRKQQIIDRLVQHDTDNNDTEKRTRNEEATAGEADAASMTVEEVVQENQIEDVDTTKVAGERTEVEVEAEAKAPKLANEAAIIASAKATEVTPSSPTGSDSGQDESRKRKRRSLTPAVDEAEVQKKLKHDDESPGDAQAAIVADAPIQMGEADTTINLGIGVSETETVGVLGTTADTVATAEAFPDSLGPEDAARNVPQPLTNELVPTNMSRQANELTNEATQDDAHENVPSRQEENIPVNTELGSKDAIEQSATPTNPLAATPALQDPSLSNSETTTTIAPPIEPDRHPTTRALYIRDLKRPLQPGDLENHLISLASGGADVLEEFHLDTMRTHAFASFKTVDLASTVRKELDGQIWPAERSRPPLHVYFIPEDKMRDFIAQEIRAVDTGGAAAKKKTWEVIYTKGVAGDIKVLLQGIGSIPSPSTSAPARSGPGPGPGPGPDMRIPTGPRSMIQKRSDLRQEASGMPKKPESSQFLALDTLFRSTTSKPKLYYQPVAEDLASSRLRQLQSDKEIEPGSNSDAEKCRYTWEDGQLVNGGPEFGLRRDRGRRAGFRRGGGGHGTRDLYRPSDGYRPRQD